MGQKASMNTSYRASADHINLTAKKWPSNVSVDRSSENLYAVCNEHGELYYSKHENRENNNFLRHEIRTYNQRYGLSLEQQRMRYRDTGYKKRAEELKDMWVWYNKYPPEEQVLQYGNIDTPEDIVPDRITYLEMMAELSAWEMKLLNTDNGRIVPLDVAVHCGEATRHVHRRNLYEVRNKHGEWVPGNATGVYRSAGIQPPDPEGEHVFDVIEDPEKRKAAIREYARVNNEKVTFDGMRRQKWYDILEAHGFAVDREPIVPKQSLEETKADIIVKYTVGSTKDTRRSRQRDIRQYKADKMREMNLALKAVQAEREAVQQTQAKLQAELERVQAERVQLEAERAKLRAEQQRMQENASLKRQYVPDTHENAPVSPVKPTNLHIPPKRRQAPLAVSEGPSRTPQAQEQIDMAQAIEMATQARDKRLAGQRTATRQDMADSMTLPLSRQAADNGRHMS